VVPAANHRRRRTEVSDISVAAQVATNKAIGILPHFPVITGAKKSFAADRRGGAAHP
jgi:hypothetical protein